MQEREAFDAFCRAFEQERPDLRFGRFEIRDEEALLRADHGGMKIFWLYQGEGDVFLPKGFRTKEGDGQKLPLEYVPDAIVPGVLERLTLLSNSLDRLTPSAQAPVQAILSRCHDGVYVGDFANDLWKLEHAPESWSKDDEVIEAIRFLFSVYRECGYSTKTTDSYERIMEGDQLIVAGTETLSVRGRFTSLTLEKVDRASSHIPAVMRLRYLKDSSGGCNFDFDPFRRLPLTWHLNLPGETGDGVNFANSHVVHIARETSPTHVHPRKAIGGGHPQHEFYLVLDPRAYGLNTYARQASLIVFPDLRDLRQHEQHALSPGHWVYIPPGVGHRGLDVFVNVITIPGFKPHNEYYIDQDIRDTTRGKAPHNENLLGIKNYGRIEELI
jgi:hypothetical protein